MCSVYSIINYKRCIIKLNKDLLKNIKKFIHIELLTEQQIGISVPNMFSGVTPKLPAVSTTSGKMFRGSFKILNAQLAHSIVNGSKIPVAEALETSIICFPAINK